MRVFILCTGRSGSVTIIRACRHITNFTSAHESLATELGQERFDYPDNHIEADNRLSWSLGVLDKEFGNEAVYVHLVRDKKKTVRSFARRFNRRGSLIHAYCEGLLMTPPEKLDEEERLQACRDLYDTVNTNIEHFLKDKDKAIRLRLEKIKEDFPKFWKMIGAEGDLKAALKEFDIRHNESAQNLSESSLAYNVKLFFLKIWRRLTISTD